MSIGIRLKPLLTYTAVLLMSSCVAAGPGKRSFVPKNPKRGLERTSDVQVALVIGNNDYQYSRLRNPVNDATDMAKILEQTGFEVILKTNASQKQMDEAINHFKNRLLSTQGIGLFFFAGHGTQVNGENYLLPIDNERIQDETDLEYHAVPVSKILTKMEQADAALNVIILDACRDNPFRSLRKGRTLRRGLARIQPPGGSIIAYATDSGDVASDNSISGRNGLFTSHLLQAFKTAHRTHQRLDDMFMQVSNAVLQESDGKQQPWYLASLREPYCLGGCQSTPVQPASGQPQVVHSAQKPRQRSQVDVIRSVYIDVDNDSTEIANLLKRRLRKKGIEVVYQLGGKVAKVEIRSQVRNEDMFGQKLSYLTTEITVTEAGKTIFDERYQVSGSSSVDYRSALKNASKALIEVLTDNGFFDEVFK